MSKIDDFIRNVTKVLETERRFLRRNQKELVNAFMDVRKRTSNFKRINTDSIARSLHEKVETLNLLRLLLGISETYFSIDFSTIWQHQTKITGYNALKKKIKDDIGFAYAIAEYLLRNYDLKGVLKVEYRGEELIPFLAKMASVGKSAVKRGRLLEDIVEERLKDINILYEGKDKTVPGVRKKIDFAIPNFKNPLALIETSFYGSSGSRITQTARSIRDIREDLNRSGKGKCILIAVIDGAGWIARQDDLKKVFSYASYVIQVRTLNLLEEILKTHVPQSFK